LLIEDTVIAELKAAEAIADAHTARLMNYLKATTNEAGFVFNFGPEATFQRRYFSNAKKKHSQRNPREFA
jgi:GxxExxY protein